jgi:glycosyltransferase involved in cell wall biosynthesis
MLSPYRNPVFADLGGRAGLDLLVLTFSEDQGCRHWDLDRLYADASFRCERLARNGGRFGIWHGLRNFSPDVVVVGGYDAPECWAALLYCKALDKKAVLWSGTTRRSVRRRGMASALRRSFIRMSHSFVAYGTLAKDFLLCHGACPERIVIGYNTVDVDYFAEQAASCRTLPEYHRLRERISPVSLLFVGRLLESKGLSYLLAAMRQLSDPRVSLVVLGDGPLRKQYEAEAHRDGLRVSFEGFCKPAKLPLYYAACDVFVFPTLSEAWGLVVNEAMASRLPVVSSIEAGASHDLVRQGYNGWIVDPRNTAELASAVDKLVTDRELRSQMGHASARLIQQFTPHALADAIVSAAFGVEAGQGNRGNA